MFSASSDLSSVGPRFHFWRLFKWLIISGLLIVAADAIFQFSRMQWENHRFPPRGRLVDIGGLRLHINCTGAGSPTVVMENGPNDSSVVWQLVQPEVSKFTRVCSYDRAGFGWSDAPNEPRTSSNIADELNRLLTRAAIPGRYVFVAFEYGALNVRMFTSRHREQVMGMVLVDPTHPDMHHRPPFNASTPRSTLVKAYYYLMLWTVPLGVPAFLAGVGTRSRTSPRNATGSRQKQLLNIVAYEPGAPSTRKQQMRMAPCPVKLAPSAICRW